MLFIMCVLCMLYRKACLVRLGETHTSRCRPRRETPYTVGEFIKRTSRKINEYYGGLGNVHFDFIFTYFTEENQIKTTVKCNIPVKQLTELHQRQTSDKGRVSRQNGA